MTIVRQAAGLRDRLGQVARELTSPARLNQAPSGPRLAIQIQDYVRGMDALFWQRQSMYIGSCALALAYYDLFVGSLFFLLMQVAELCDNLIVRLVVRNIGALPRMARRFYSMFFYSSILSSLVVACFAVSIARIEGHTLHFVPVFFLFTAGLFAAINNHQLPRILFARLTVYSLVLIGIPVYDIVSVKAPLDSVLWLQLTTISCLLFFFLDCPRHYLVMYRRAMEHIDEMRAERDGARAAYEVKSQFVSTVSHELRTPLTSILGSLGLLQSGAFASEPDQQDEVIGIAYKNSQRLSHLINDLLDLQKIESGQMRYSFGPVDLAELAGDTIRMMAGYAEKRRVSLELVSEAGAVAQVDRQRIEQVLFNLLSNAVKFSPEDGVVEMRVRPRADTVRIEVHDSGIGIPPGSEEVVFGKFSQVDSSDHRSHGGSGLGLNISRNIVEAHGGTLSYRSTQGAGTVFLLDLPAARGGTAAAG